MQLFIYFQNQFTFLIDSSIYFLPDFNLERFNLQTLYEIPREVSLSLFLHSLPWIPLGISLTFQVVLFRGTTLLKVFLRVFWRLQIATSKIVCSVRQIIILSRPNNIQHSLLCFCEINLPFLTHCASVVIKIYATVT